MKRERAAASTTTWMLFIDESGDFDDPSARVVVAGLLLRPDAVAVGVDRLTRALRDDFSDVPYPPHTSTLTHSMSAVVEREAAKRGKGRTSWEILSGHDSEALDAAAKILGASFEREQFSQAVKAKADGARLDHRALTSFRHVVDRSDPGLAELLQEFARRRVARLRRHLQSLPTTSPPQAATLVVAAEERHGVGPGNAPDRYLHLLDLVIGRSADVVLRHGGQHRLELVVYRRGVREPKLATSNAPLALPHINDSIRRAGGPRMKRGANELTVLAADVQGDSMRTDVRLILADFIANRARREVFPRAIGPLDQALRIETGLEPTSGVPPACHVAAAGRPEEAIRRHKSGAPAGEVAALVASMPNSDWARAQAEQWIEVLQFAGD